MSYYEYEDVLTEMEFPLPITPLPAIGPTLSQLLYTKSFELVLVPIRFTGLITQSISMLLAHVLSTFFDVTGTILSSGIAVTCEFLASIGDFLMSLPEVQDLELDFGDDRVQHYKWKFLGVLAFIGLLAFLNFRHRHAIPHVRQDLEVVVEEYAKRVETLEAEKQTKEEYLKKMGGVESERDRLLEERMETFKEIAELSSENTLLTNKIGKLEPFKKECNDLKWQLERVDKKEDHMKGLESKCRRLEKQLAKAQEDQDDSKSLQIFTEIEVETLERGIKEKNKGLKDKESELKAARRTRQSDEVAVKKAHRMVFLLSTKAHKERRSALQAQRLYRQARQEAKHQPPTALPGDTPTPHECDYSPYLRTIKLQADTIVDLKKQLSVKTATETAVVAVIPPHVCDHTKCELLAIDHERELKLLEDRADELNSLLEASEEKCKQQADALEVDMDDYLCSDDVEEPATKTSTVPPGEEDRKESAAKKVLEVALPAAHEVPLPEATDADIEGQHSLLEDRDATIDQLQATLREEEAQRKALEAKDAEHVCDHSQCSSQANEKDGRIQELDDQLTAQKQNSEEYIQELGVQLTAQKQSTEELKTCLETCRGEKETALASLVNERKTHEKNRQIAKLSTMTTSPSNGNELKDLKRDLSAKVLQCEGLRQTLADKDATIASLNGDIFRASNQFDNLKQSLGMSSGYGITEVEHELQQWKAAFEGLSREARNHVCDHSKCHYNYSQLELQTATLQQALDDAKEQYVELEKTVKDMDTAIKKRNSHIKGLAAKAEEQDKEHQALKKKLLSDIEVAKGQAGLRYETSQPGYRPLRDQLLDMKATLDVTKQNLEKTTQELKDRSQERDHEMRCALGFKEDSNRFAASAQQEQAAYFECKKARDELANQKRWCEQEIERLKIQRAELEKKNSDLAIEVANHTTKAPPSGRKRGGDAEKDEPKKKGRADL